MPERAILNTSEWLSTKELNAALISMSQQWPGLKVQPVEYIQRPKHSDAAVSCGHGDYVQVIHMDTAKHWVSVTNIAGHGRPRLFDSLNLQVPHKVLRAIASKWN